MVLKNWPSLATSALSSALISSFLALTPSQSFAQTPLKDAQKLARRGQYDKALNELEKKFDFTSSSTPVAASATACLWGNRIFSHEKAAQTAEAGIKAHMPWWSNYLKTKKDETVDVSEYLAKTQKNHLVLLGCYGEAKSKVYFEKHRKLSPKERAQMRHEIKKTYDFLIQSDYPTEKSEEFNARVAEADDRAVKSRKKFFFDATIQYMFWQEVFKYSGAGSGNGQANVQVLCPGFQLGLRSFFTEYGVGMCLGYGKAKMDFDGLAFKDNNQAVILDFNASAIRKLADNRMGIGVELNSYLNNIDGVSVNGYKTKLNNEFRFGALLVTRLNFDGFSFDIKGGRYMDLPSAMFTVGFTANLKEQ